MHSSASAISVGKRRGGTRSDAAFSEVDAWRDVGAGWQKLFGSFRAVGYSIEWHDFLAKREFDWKSCHSML